VLGKNTQLPWEVPAQQQLATQFQVTMRKPQQASPRTIFYPGQLEQATIPTELQVRYGVAPENVVAVDQAEDADGVPQRYQVTVAGSTATAAQLARAGTVYPTWAKRYAQSLDTAYLPRAVLNKIHTLALQAIAVAQPDPYDEATAIQNYLREYYTYTLTPRPVPQGEDPLEAFLDHQTGGYCVYFATAMADMLRSLGIPVILANGFGPGTFNPSTGRFVVRASDAHTWPEVYFPGYGWISYEPTPQTGYGTIPRGGTAATCPSDICGSGAATSGIGGNNPIAGRGQLTHGLGAGAQHSAKHARFPWMWPVLGGLGVLLLVALVLSVRWLRPRTLAATWRRTRRLALLAGIPAEPAESPREFGLRLGRAVPALAPAAQALADQVTIAAYAPPGTGPQSTSAAEGWGIIRLYLLRAAVRRRLRPGRSRAAA
jgi:transglutaminase-like putative cysteine protease